MDYVGCPLNEVILYPIDELIEFDEVIFKAYHGVRLGEMMKSIEGAGVLTPVIVRDTGEEYQILSGHNRVRACKAIDRKYIPVYNVGEISDDVARFIVTESNIVQRGLRSYLMRREFLLMLG